MKRGKKMYKKGDLVKVFVNGKAISGAVIGKIGLNNYSVILSTGFRKMFSAAELFPNAAF